MCAYIQRVLRCGELWVKIRVFSFKLLSYVVCACVSIKCVEDLGRIGDSTGKKMGDCVL